MKQIAEWQHNKTAVQQQVKILSEITKYLVETTGSNNDVYYSVENNTVGEAALISISEIGEDNIKGIFLSEPKRAGSGRRYRKGFYTTHAAKISACAKLKHLIESDRMEVNSKALISELKTYIAKGLGFEAKVGQHDDLVSAMLLAVRMAMVLQDWDPAVYDKMREEREDEWVMPMPVYVSSF